MPTQYFTLRKTAATIKRKFKGVIGIRLEEKVKTANPSYKELMQNKQGYPVLRI